MIKKIFWPIAWKLSFVNKSLTKTKYAFLAHFLHILMYPQSTNIILSGLIKVNTVSLCLMVLVYLLLYFCNPTTQIILKLENTNLTD